MILEDEDGVISESSMRGRKTVQRSFTQSLRRAPSPNKLVAANLLVATSSFESNTIMVEDTNPWLVSNQNHASPLEGGERERGGKNWILRLERERDGRGAA